MDIKPPPSAPQDIQKEIQKESISTWRPFLIGSMENIFKIECELPQRIQQNLLMHTTLSTYIKTTKTERRPSITEQFFGSSMPGRLRSNSTTEYEENESKFKQIDLKQFMKHQRKILGDDEWQ
ncbi:hypothetical protein Mgra_00000240 [Meloidogyne graminicola]|uniref:Uncharacterized protein n=1 Tax=Meloidogyne graminicola TaxID=189291 RepID=A0A8T0A4F1_9BILA|nr:hypothetical protein Mgra_00000240 [Meloidogyne graminicola]